LNLPARAVQCGGLKASQVVFRSSKTVGVQTFIGKYLISVLRGLPQSPTNADGDPAADGTGS
jgi:hypothetical protein